MVSLCCVFVCYRFCMAQRRMFSNRIANSARFLQMPSEAQALYFHMILRADDDGVVESYPIVKLLGVAPDSLKILSVKGFVQHLNEDQVVIITDWLEHNAIRADRKVDSIYRHLLPVGIKTIAAKPRSDVDDNSKRVGGPSTDGIGKVRLGKDREEKPSASMKYLDAIPETDMQEFLRRFDASAAQIRKKAEGMRLYCQSHGKQYKNYKAFLLNAMIRDLPIRKSQPVATREMELPLTPEQKRKNEEHIARIGEIARGRRI